MLASKWKSRAISTLMLVGLLVGAGLFVTPGIRDKALSFIFKTDATKLDESEFSFDAFTHSRQGLVEGSMEGFRESPMIGNGFQVVKGMEDLDVRSWKQLLSAPIEKGVWVYAVLEEGGVFGFLIFSLYLIIAMVQLLCRGAYIGASTLMVFVVSNLGEFTIFSMSANGGIMWALTFAGATLDAFRGRRETMAGAYGMRPLGAPPPVFNPYSAVPPGPPAYVPRSDIP